MLLILEIVPNIPSCATDSGNTCIYLDSDTTFSCPKDEIVLGLPNNCNNVELINAVTFDITPSTDKYCTEDSKCTSSDTRICSVDNDHCVLPSTCNNNIKTSFRY